MGGFTFAHGLVLIVAAFCMFAVSTANKDWKFGFNNHWPPHKGGSDHPKYRQAAPNKVIIGGSEGWRFNFSYTNWAFKHGPFYLNDTLGELTCFKLYINRDGARKFYGRGLTNKNFRFFRIFLLKKFIFVVF
jgi:hypothetical protein